MLIKLDTQALNQGLPRSSYIQIILKRELETIAEQKASNAGRATWKTSYDPDLENFFVDNGYPVPKTLHRPPEKPNLL